MFLPSIQKSTLLRALKISSLALFSSLALLPLEGCGRKSGPKPPEATAPAEVMFPSAGGSPNGIVLTWQAPTTDESGASLINLTGFRVFRGVFTKGSSTDYKLIQTITLPLDQPVPQQFSYSDSAVTAGVTYDYAIEATNDEDTGGRVTQILRVSFRGTSSAIEVVAPPRDASID